MALPQREQAPDPELKRTGRRLSAPGLRFTALGVLPLAAGVLLLLLASGWAWALGIVLIALSLPVLAVGVSLLLGGGVAGWAAKRWPFA